MSRTPLREAELDKLMARLAGGDRTAFDALYVALHARATRVVSRRAPAAKAPDIVQNAMMNVFSRASEFTAGRHCLPWFYAVVANEIRAAHRRDARLVVTDEVPEPVDEADPEALMIRRELDRALELAIDALDDDASNAIRVLLGQAPAPLLADTTFRKRVSRAYAKLRLRLRGHDAG